LEKAVGELGLSEGFGTILAANKLLHMERRRPRLRKIN